MAKQWTPDEVAQRVMTDFVGSACTVESIAARHDLPIETVIEALISPAAVRVIDALARAEEMRERVLSVRARVSALYNLPALTWFDEKSVKSYESRRRACEVILRSTARHSNAGGETRAPRAATPKFAVPPDQHDPSDSIATLNEARQPPAPATEVNRRPQVHAATQAISAASRPTGQERSTVPQNPPYPAISLRKQTAVSTLQSATGAPTTPDRPAPAPPHRTPPMLQHSVCPVSST